MNYDLGGRGKNETLRELAQDIQRLMTLAYPGERSSLSDNIERDMFLAALDDEELQLKIREKESPDLEAAVKYAQTFEASKMAVEMNARDRHRILRQVKDTNLGVRVSSLETESCEDHVSSIVDSTKPNKSYYQYQRNVPKDRVKKNRATSSEDSKWKVDLVKNMETLQNEQIAMISQSQQLIAKNDSLSKEVERLRHLEQVRALPIWNQNSVTHSGSNGQTQ